MDQLADLYTERPNSLIPPLAVSLLVHALLAMLFVSAAMQMPRDTSSPIDVEILEPEQAARRARAQPSKPAEKAPAPEPAVQLPKTQIVSPPDSPEQKSDKAKLLSDRDSRADQETIKQGAPASAPKPPAQTAKAEDSRPGAKERPATKAAGDSSGTRRGDASGITAERANDATTRTAPLPGLGDLFVKPSELARDPALRRGESGTDQRTEDGGKRDLALLNHPELWPEPAPHGAFDFLPNVRSGDITMLNTKADRFAPFVRRVGLRVFQSFSMQFKQQIYAGQVPEGRDDVQIEAVMSRDGKRMEVSLKQHSGNLSTDRTLLGTLNDQTFFDDNPPAEAVAADGHIHFVFALNSMVSAARDPRRGRQPGAQWVMGAGLL